MGLKVKQLISWGYNHKQYLYSRVFWSEEFIPANILKSNHNINIESKMAALICITESEIVGFCVRVVLIMVQS